MIDVSVSIVVYRHYDEVKKTISDIEEYTNAELQKKIYIIDNSGFDDDNENKSEFKKWLEKYKDIEFVDTQNNLGFGKGHNFVLDRLDSQYHAIVNPDIMMKEDALSRLISFMSEQNVGMSVPKIVDEDGNIQPVYRREITLLDVAVRMFFPFLFKKRQAMHTLQDKNFDKPFKVPFAQGSFLVLRTDLFKKLDGFDDRYFMYLEDADLCRRVNEISAVMYCPYTSVVHLWEKGSHKSLKLFRFHIKSMLQYFKKWGFKLF